MDPVERKCNRDMADAMETSAKSPVPQEPRRRVDDLHSDFVVRKEVVKGHAQWLDPEMKAHWVINHATPVEAVDAAISAWTADECQKSLRAETFGGKGEAAWGLGPRCEGARPFSMVIGQGFRASNRGAPSKTIVGTRWALTGEMVAGVEDAKAKLAPKG